MGLFALLFFLTTYVLNLSFIESRDFFFLTTIDHRGYPTYS